MLRGARQNKYRCGAMCRKLAAHLRHMADVVVSGASRGIVGGRLGSWSRRKHGIPEGAGRIDPGSRHGLAYPDQARRGHGVFDPGHHAECRRGLGVGVARRGTGRAHGFIPACCSMCFVAGTGRPLHPVSRVTPGVRSRGCIPSFSDRANAWRAHAREHEKVQLL